MNATLLLWVIGIAVAIGAAVATAFVVLLIHVQKLGFEAEESKRYARKLLAEIGEASKEQLIQDTKDRLEAQQQELRREYEDDAP